MKTGSGGRFAFAVLVCVHCRGVGIQTRCPQGGPCCSQPSGQTLGAAPALQMLLRLQPVDWAAYMLTKDFVRVLQPELSSMLPWLLHYLHQFLNRLLQWQLLVLTRLWQALLRATLHAPCPAPLLGSASRPAVPPFCLLRLCVLASPFSFDAEHSPSQAPPSRHPRHKRKVTPMPQFQVGKDIPNRPGDRAVPCQCHKQSAQHSLSRLAQIYSMKRKVPRTVCLSSWNL